ncbi:MAG: 50S ribosomal protein L24 [Sulfolobaceae archaeon]
MVSSKPSKQRLLLYNLPYHQRKKLLTARVSEEIEKEYGIKRIPIRTGDVVRVMRGDYKGSEGKVVKVERKTGRIMIEGITRKRSDGTDVYVKIHASKVMIIKLDTSDTKRMEAIKKKAELRRKYLETIKKSAE